MAFDSATRNRLQRFVNEARKCLETEFTQQLQSIYGLDPVEGRVAEVDDLVSLTDTQRETARILRDTLAHYCAAEHVDAAAGLDRIVREQAFTVLNRLAALRMAEARGLLIESVGNAYQAKGFQLYARMAGTGLGETGDAYRVYLFSLFDELSEELPTLFGRFSPQGRLFPKESVLLELIGLVNDPEVERLWAEDETIGWIYQYFNSKEERKAMRDASQAPRNSRELAVRNQFFTPRYVVEFLVDNTLGRLWFDATGGATELRERCKYLLVKPDESPEAATKLRDPRTIRLLDPACGSMHFGLYAFDLFIEIYREAWVWEKEHGPGSLDVSTQPEAALKPLSQTYEDGAAFRRDVPRLVIEHNIYGVDIDPRAAQIASLALWLRAQRAWHEAEVTAKHRPVIGRGHVVAAIAPPAERELRQQFVEDLDQRDAELFEKTLHLLKDLPELGVLLQLEREIPHLIRRVYAGKGTGLFAEQEQGNWQEAEARLRAALTEFAQAARSTYKGRLFAQDALDGLRLVDVLQSQFDVLVMNPPFGLPALGTKETLKRLYPNCWTDYYNAFIMRATELVRSTGRIGAVVPNRLLYAKKSSGIRELLSSTWEINTLVDAGRDVMDDAAVDALFFTAGQSEGLELIQCPVLDLKSTDVVDRPTALLAWTNSPTEPIDFSYFKSIPGNTFSVAAPISFLKLWKRDHRLDPDFATVATGGKTFDDTRFLRLRWEVLPQRLGNRWVSVDTGGNYQMWYSPSVFVQNWERDGIEVRSFAKARHATDAQVIQGSKSWFMPGISYPYTSSIGFSPRILPAGTIFTSDAIAIHPKAKADALPLLSILSSSWTSELLNCFGEGRKTENSLVKSLPLDIEDSSRICLSEAALDAIYSVVEIEAKIETSPLFRSPFGGADSEDIERRLKRAISIIDIPSRSAYGLPGDALVSANNSDLVSAYVGRKEPAVDAHAIVSYLVGVVFGRWDIRYATGAMDCKILDDVFSALPATPPGSAKDVARQEIDGVVGVDGGSECLSEKVRVQLRAIFGSSYEQKEIWLCSSLACPSILAYLLSPSGFFLAHLKGYSQGARRAPIFWPLSTESGSFQLWVYYPSLTSQTLYTAINDFVEPKIKQVGADVSFLRNKGMARTRDDEKRFEALQAFELELMQFRDTLLKLAPTYKPNHDDGVQISAAPLWSLFRHKPWQNVLKDTWAKLKKGDYDWAHLAMNYWPDRVREKCKTDKSLAIAHGLEELYVEPTPGPNKPRGKKRKE